VSIDPAVLEALPLAARQILPVPALRAGRGAAASSSAADHVRCAALCPPISDHARRPFLSNLPRFNRQQVRLLLVEKRVRIDGKVVSDPHSEVLEFSRVEVDEQVLQAVNRRATSCCTNRLAASVRPAIRSTRPCSI
jgi:hypothetical protein